MKDVVDLRHEKVAVESEEENYLELEDLEGGRGRILSRRDTLSVESAVTRFAKGDVLFGKLRPYLEKYCQPDFDGYCTGEILAFFPRRIYGRYLFYHMGSDWLIQRCNALAYGAKMPRVNWPTQFALFNIPLPPLTEQKRIAAYLDASCAAIDRAVETKQKQLETLDALRKSIIQRAVTQGLNPKVQMKESGVEWLGQVPEHWKRRTIKRVCEFSPTYSQGKPEAHEACTFVPMASVSTLGVIDSSDVKPMSDIIAGLNLFENGDVIFAKITPCMENGKGAVIRNLITHFAYGSTEFHVMRPNHAIIADYLYFYLHNKVFREWAEKNMHGAAGQQRVGTKFLKYTYIFLPTEDEQIEIIKYVRQRLEEITSIEENVSRQIATLTAYRKSLIHECVTGKRRISDSDVAKVEAHV